MKQYHKYVGLDVHKERNEVTWYSLSSPRHNGCVKKAAVVRASKGKSLPPVFRGLPGRNRVEPVRFAELSLNKPIHQSEASS